MADKEEKTHDETCPGAKNANKWIVPAQAILQRSVDGKHPLFVTTLVCQVCGYIKFDVAPLDLPTPPTVSVPNAGLARS